MKTLFSKPILLAFVLSLFLWVIFKNYLLALFCAILISYFISMLRALRTLSKNSKDRS